MADLVTDPPIQGGTEPPGEVPDLEILVRQQGGPGRPVLEIELTARDPRLRLNHLAFATRELRQDIPSYVRDLFRDVEQLSPSDPATLRRRLAAKGSLLLRELVPEALQELLWDLRSKVSTVLIQSQEPWIPWELIKLQHPQSGESGPFLCEAFAVTRWLQGRPFATHLPWRSVAVVLPSHPDLAAVGEEWDFLASLAVGGREVRQIEAQPDTVLDELRTGNWEGWHFAGHGLRAPGSNPDKAILLLDDRRSLLPEDLAGGPDSLARSRPLVFLNGCQTGGSAFALTHPGGWAARFLEMGAGAFLGSYWAITDSAARLFAEELYRGFLAGKPLGEAVRAARLALPRDDSTWLAYTVFAHPLARCQPAPAAPDVITPCIGLAPDPPPASGRREEERADRRAPQLLAGLRRRPGWSTVLAVGAGAVLAVLLLWLGRDIHRERELLLGLGPLRYPWTELLASAAEAFVSLPWKALAALAPGQHPALRWSAGLALLMAALGVALGRRPRLQALAALPLLGVTTAVLALGSLLFALAIRPLPGGAAQQPDLRAQCPQPEQNWGALARFETCRWLTENGRHDSRREGLNGLILWLALALAANAWAIARRRDSGGAARLGRALLGAQLLVALFLATRLPVAHTFGKWGLRYPPVVAVDPDCDRQIALQVRRGACAAYDVAAGAAKPCLLLLGDCGEARPHQVWFPLRPSCFEIRLPRQTVRPPS